VILAAVHISSNMYSLAYSEFDNSFGCLTRDAQLELKNILRAHTTVKPKPGENEPVFG
jgi:hypothetical protein